MSRLNIDMELVRTFTLEQYARGLLAWGWLRPSPMEPIFASAFGDVFFRAADGIWWLDTIEGSISRRWESEEALRAEIDTVAGQDNYLLAGLAVAAESAGCGLGPARYSTSRWHRCSGDRSRPTTSSSWTSSSSSQSLVSFTIRYGGCPQIPRSPALRSTAQESYGY
jgi:hypothetical protein